MDLIKSILGCLTGYEANWDDHSDLTFTSSKTTSGEKEERLATDVIQILFAAEKDGPELKGQLNNLVHTEGWYEGLAKTILDQLVAALKTAKNMGHAMKKAFDKAYNVAEEFIHKHPVFAAAILTVVAIGILVLLTPWVVEALGFGELGPIEGSFAAWWQSTFPDAEAGSFFAFLQRLGMIWKK